MVNMRTILFVIGLVLCAVAATMVLPALLDLVAGEGEWVGLLVSALITAFFGITLCLTTWSRVEFSLSVRDAFVLTSLAWITTSAFASLPFILSTATHLSLTDAVFETVSGLTTTGSTVLTGLDHLPRGILFWRSFLQWVGGAGIIIMAVVLLPFLRVGGMQLFRTESSDRSDKIVPSSFQLVRYIFGVYLGLTLACAFAYHLGGMSWFDAVNHSMTTLATGGYSTHDASFAFYASRTLQWIGTFFMVVASLPLAIYIRAVRGEPSAIWRNSQVRAFLVFVAGVSLLLALWLWQLRGFVLADALTVSAFSVASIVSTTGFVSDDYTGWGALAVAAFLILTLVGGCTGSTAGGIKMFRHQTMFLMIRTHLISLVMPRRVYTPIYEGHVVDRGIIISVLAFVSVFVLSLLIFTLGLAATGLDLVTSLSGAATAIANVGPGLGNTIGPVGNFTSLNEASKALLIVGMLLGRLEFFTLLVLLSPDFWR